MEGLRASNLSAVIIIAIDVDDDLDPGFIHGCLGVGQGNWCTQTEPQYTPGDCIQSSCQYPPQAESGIHLG